MIHTERSRAHADIQSHLELNGSRKWSCLRKQYETVSEPTWWRWVREAKAHVGAQNLVPGEEAQAKRVPSQANFGVPRFDFLAAFHSLFADAMALRAHALDRDGRVRKPDVFDRAMKMRLKLIGQGVKLTQQILDARAQQTFYDALIGEIAAESPEVQRRLITRLRAFNHVSDPRRTEEP
jgi:hypothetical protein